MTLHYVIPQADLYDYYIMKCMSFFAKTTKKSNELCTSNFAYSLIAIPDFFSDEIKLRLNM